MADSRIDELRKRLEREPGSRLFAQLAEELRKSGELAEAIRVCREGLQKQPTYHSARMTLARSFLDSGDLQAARPEFEAVLRAAPDNILASRLLGECLEGLGDLQGARTRYKTTLALAPGDKQAQGRLEAVEARLAAPAAEPQPAPSPPVTQPAPAVVAEAFPEPQTLDFDEPPPVEEEPKPIPLVAVEESFELEAAYEAPAMRVGTEAPAATVAETPLPEPTSAGLEVDQEFVDFEAEAPLLAEPLEVMSRVPLTEEAPQVASPPEAVAPQSVDTASKQPVAELASATLAELYFSQGHPERAIEVYRQVLEREPRNDRASARLSELIALQGQPTVRDEPQRIPEAVPVAAGAARREALWRTIRQLEGMLAAVRRA